MKNVREEFSKEVIVIDCSNLIYRMFYVHQDLSNSKGYKTGAIYGFFKMLLYYTEKLKINNMVLVWDTPSEFSWRLQIYPDYKKRRRNVITDEDKALIKKEIILSQEKIYVLSQLLGFLCLKKVAYEADDLIGMFVKHYPRNVKIITMDKDLLQLISDKNKVRVYRPGIGRGSYQVYNEQTIKDEFNIEPKDFHRLLAIAGDSTDDVPGVKGYAYKKASVLINENEVETKLTKEQREIYERNLILVNLHNVPGEIKTKDFKLKKSSIELAQKFLDDLEIKKYSALELSKLNDDRDFKVSLFRRFL